MNEATASFYLPISREGLVRVLNTPADSRRLLAELRPSQMASLYFLQGTLPDDSRSDARISEKRLGELVEACQSQFESDEPEQLVEHAIENLNYEKIQAGYEYLPDLNIAMLEQSDVEKGEYLNNEERWNYDFQVQHKKSIVESLVAVVHSGGKTLLNSEQGRLYRDFESQHDEHMHVQGYAGTGKTTFIRCILAALENTNAKILILANRKPQLDALRADIEGRSNVDGCVFSKLIEMIIPDDCTLGVSNAMRAPLEYRATNSDSEIIQHLNLYASESLSANELVGIVRRTLFRFCQTPDSEIDVHHIPRRILSGLDTTTKQVVCHYTTEYWKLILSPPSREFKPQLRGYHKIKWAALNGFEIPETYTHVLVDESHDIPGAMLQILDNSPQARLTLGDVYQNLNGVELKQSSVARARELTRSVRSSHHLEQIINPLIFKHPSRTKAKFYGNTMHRMNIEYYQKAKVPDSSMVILVNDVWEMFEWIQRIANRRLSINLLSSKQAVDWFVKDCIELYKHGTKATHAELFRFSTWEAVSHQFANHPGFNRIEKLLEKNYGFEDWLKASTFIGPGVGHTLALIEDVRNLEFNDVMLSPSISEDSLTTYNAAFCSSVYVSVTRATQRLLLPESLRNHIEEMTV